jgi:site-specific DNA-methyltransferase (adenine-specific)
VRAVIYHGDCLDVLRVLADNSVDSVVCDPPYGLRFMGRKWDYDVPSVEVWAECLRVLKPGGHLLAFAGTRTHHRMCVRIEDAGFEIRDMIAWVYGSGFNKVGYIKKPDGSHVIPGFGGSLKPAMEPITVARKPLTGTVAANVLEWGCGALNVDGCRIAGESTQRTNTAEMGYHGGNLASEYKTGSDAGRWPSNLIHDGSDEVVGLFPAQAGAAAPVHKRNGDKFRQAYGAFHGNIDEAGSTFHGDKGSAARFFYCAKATRKDRGDGNNHPTVKPTDLMRYLARLVTPPGGAVLDPFAGSGSTGKACALEGFEFIGIEREAEYVEIARARIAAARRSIGADPADIASRNPAQQVDLFSD